MSESDYVQIFSEKTNRWNVIDVDSGLKVAQSRSVFQFKYIPIVETLELI